MRLVRYADDFVVMVGGRRSDAEALFDIEHSLTYCADSTRCCGDGATTSVMGV
jgi:hypothetical protein